MSGADYVAVRRISNKAGVTLAAVGERCDRVPAEALGWLEAKGAIRTTQDPDVAEKSGQGALQRQRGGSQRRPRTEG